MRNLLSSSQFLVVEPPASAGTTTLTSDAVDLSGWGGVVFVASLGDVTVGSELALKAHHSHKSAEDFVLLEDYLEHEATASDADNKLMILDISSPERRYVRVTLERESANAVVNGIIAIRYRPGQSPPPQLTAHVLAFDILSNPKAA